MYDWGVGGEETAICNDGTIFKGTEATVGDGFSCNYGTFYQGTDA